MSQSIFLSHKGSGPEKFKCSMSVTERLG